MDSNEASVATKATTTKRRHLPADGQLVLQKVLDKGVTHPLKPQRLELLNQIHDLGHTWYTEESVNHWFIHRRRKMKQSQAQARSAATSVDTSMDAHHLINILSSATPNPSWKLIETWAKLTHSTPDDVQRWVKDNNPVVDQSSVNNLASGSGRRSSIVAEDAESDEEPLMKRVVSGSAANPAPANVPASYSPSPPIPQISPEDQLLSAIHAGLSSSPSDPPLPRSSSQFNTLFAPYETMMDDFVNDVKTGSISDRGWNMFVLT